MGVAEEEDGPSEIDIMIAYTPAVVAELGDPKSVHRRIESLIQLTNQCFLDSAIGARLTLVHRMQVEYSEQEDMRVDLRRLHGTGDGFMDEIHAVRDRVGADLVSLLVGYNQAYCGAAYVLNHIDMFSPADLSISGFSVVAANAPTRLAFVHEIGHNFGCQHDPANTGFVKGLFPFSHGHVFGGTDARAFQTVMSYGRGRALLRFSNPAIQHAGMPTGIEGQADNARTINLSAPFVARYRTRRPLRIVSGITHAPARIRAGHEVRFSVLAASPHGQVRYNWDFGDGAVVQGGESVSHTFNSAGPYTVTVTMTDRLNTISEQLAIDVTEPGGRAIAIHKLCGSLFPDGRGKYSMSGEFPSRAVPTRVEINAGGMCRIFEQDGNKPGKLRSLDGRSRLRVKKGRFRCGVSGMWPDTWLNAPTNRPVVMMVTVKSDAWTGHARVTIDVSQTRNRLRFRNRRPKRH